MFAENKDINTMAESHIEAKDSPVITEEEERYSQVELDLLDRGVKRKVDLTVLPVVIVVYLLAYIDRANIGNARVVCLSRAYRCLKLLLLTFAPRLDLRKTWK
jgi:hypothetical protein